MDLTSVILVLVDNRAHLHYGTGQDPLWISNGKKDTPSTVQCVEKTLDILCCSSFQSSEMLSPTQSGKPD